MDDILIDFDFLEEFNLGEIDLPIIDLSKIELREFKFDFLEEIDQLLLK